MAPTPISALVHSRTLIISGAVLWLKFFRVFISSYRLLILVYFSVVSLYLRGVKRVLEKDLKKIVAISTIRQVSLMFLVLGLNCKVLMFFHLLSHAGFKFLLFLRVGRVIFMRFRAQDLRGSKRAFYEHKFIARVCIFGIMGLFFTTGAVSKEIIIGTVTLVKRSFLFLIRLRASIVFTMYYSFVLVIRFYFVVKLQGRIEISLG